MPPNEQPKPKSFHSESYRPVDKPSDRFARTLSMSSGGALRDTICQCRGTAAEVFQCLTNVNSRDTSNKPTGCSPDYFVLRNAMRVCAERGLSKILDVYRDDPVSDEGVIPVDPNW